MNPGYRIPDDRAPRSRPARLPKRTVPISRLNVRSFITSPDAGARIRAGSKPACGIAFDDGHGIREVLFSDDGGRRWQAAELGASLGNYAFREWTIPWAPSRAGTVVLMAPCHQPPRAIPAAGTAVESVRIHAQLRGTRGGHRHMKRLDPSFCARQRAPSALDRVAVARIASALLAWGADPAVPVEPARNSLCRRRPRPARGTTLGPTR